ncbi:MAG: invasion associated locus B family protein [Alphaproteobacteria bacterium]|nr:invasion associated locus B family protein [Alphaproteobacteria bacterium]
MKAKLFAPVLFGCGLLAGTAAAQQVAPETKRIGDFTVRCFAVKSVAPCDMFEEQINRDNGQRVVSFSLAYMPSGGRYILQITVPLGIAIDKGVVVAGGTYTSPPLPYRRCDTSACFVEVALPKDLIDNFAKLGAKAEIRVVPDGQTKPVPFPFSFDGFSAAHDDMVASNKAKAVSPEALQAQAPPAKP